MQWQQHPRSPKLWTSRLRLEGITKDREWLYDHYVDSTLYAITAPEWRAHNQG